MLQEHVIRVDQSRPLSEEPGTGHNHWHEEALEPVVEVDPGGTVVYETRDAFDGQLNSRSRAEDVGTLNLGPVRERKPHSHRPERLLNMIEHLGTRGFDHQQGYAICA
jgi:hypothetical protein